MKRIWKQAIIALAAASVAFGVWQILQQGSKPAAMVRVLSATADLPAGSTVSATKLSWVEIPQSAAGAYLAKEPPEDALMLQTVAAGELLLARAVGRGSIASQVVSIHPLVIPVRGLRVGDVVDVWASPGQLVANRATVLAVSEASGGFDASSKTVDLLVDAAFVQPLLTVQLADQPRLALVRAASASAEPRFFGGDSGQGSNG